MYDFILHHGFLILLLMATVAIFIIGIRGDRD